MNLSPVRHITESDRNLIITIMKKTVLLLAFIIITLGLAAQRNGIDNFFSRYAGLDGYTTVNINGDLLGFFAKFDDDAELNDLSRKIISIRIITSEGGIRHPEVSFASELDGVIRRGGYEELMTVRNPDDDVRIMVKTAGETIKEILVLASGDKETVIQIKGSFKQNDVENLSRRHIEGLESLEMLENSGK